MEGRQISKTLETGGVGVLLTDTLYGVVGQALNKKTVERIYTIKDRDDKKPLIILIASVQDLRLFGVKLNHTIEKILENFWPGAVSVILPCPLKKFDYLHRNTKMLAFRLPNKKNLIELLKTTGPLVAPSANPEGLPPAKNIREAMDYFGNRVDFYERGGRPKNKHSTIVVLRSNGEVEIARK